jgi:hypothetical protein
MMLYGEGSAFDPLIPFGDTPGRNLSTFARRAGLMLAAPILAAFLMLVIWAFTAVPVRLLITLSLLVGAAILFLLLTRSDPKDLLDSYVGNARAYRVAPQLRAEMSDDLRYLLRDLGHQLGGFREELHSLGMHESRSRDGESRELTETFRGIAASIHSAAEDLSRSLMMFRDIASTVEHGLRERSDVPDRDRESLGQLTRTLSEDVLHHLRAIEREMAHYRAAVRYGGRPDGELDIARLEMLIHELRHVLWMLSRIG